MKKRMKLPGPVGTPGQRGIALVIVLLVLMALTFAGVSLIGSSRIEMAAVSSDLTQTQSLFLADAGVHDGRLSLVDHLGDCFRGESHPYCNGQLYNTITDAVSSATVTLGNTTGGYAVAASGDGISGTTQFFDQVITMKSTGTGANGAAVRISLKGNPIRGSFFTNSACACESLDLGNDVSADSYQSAIGGYGSSSALGSHGNLASDGDVNVDGNVSGDITAGGDVTVGGDIAGEIYYGGSLTGDDGQQISPAPAPCQCDRVVAEVVRPILTPAVDPSPDAGIDTLVTASRTYNDNADITSSVSACPVTVPASTFTSDNLSLQSGCTVILKPNNHSYTDPATLTTKHFGVYHLNSLTMTGGPTIKIDWTATGGLPNPNYAVYVYMDGTGPWDLRTGNIYAGPDASTSLGTWALELWQWTESGAGTTIQFGMNSQFAATLFTASADISNSGLAEFFGSITAKNFNSGGTYTFHYDETVEQTKVDYVAGFGEETWRVERD